MENAQQTKWYFKTSTLIIAFLCIGPLALPLFWFNPRFNKRRKIFVSVIVLIASYLLGIAFINSLRSLSKYYQQINSLNF